MTVSTRDLEEGTSTETTHLLAPPPLANRASYRKRALSSASVAESQSSRRWIKAILTLLAAILLAGIITLIVLQATGRGGGGASPGKGNDTPDYSKLPPPQPGGRNPNYLSTGKYGGVATEVDVCSKIGVDVLKENGTATDAAIASALCIGVTNMFSSGIGGGGFMVIRPSTTHTNFNPKCTEPISIDFRETAPSGSYPHMFSPRPDDPSFDAARASKIGGLAIGVPGELRGLEAAYKACGGGVSWDRLFQPSADLARESKVGKELHRRLNASPFGVPMSQWMLEEKDWKAMFAPEGRLLVEGETLRREAYAQTLERVGREGVDIFYTGDIANSLLKTIKKEGGLLTAQDFAEYKAIVKPAFRSTYLNRTYYTTHYPSGGPIITNLLNTLEGYDDFVDQGKTGLSIHRFIEALKFAFAARTEVGDPAFIDNAAKLAEIPTKAYSAKIRANITDDRTHKIDYYQPRFDVKEDHGTTHLSVVDQYGSAVSLTSTVNLLFGSRVMDKDTGIILNDEMDDFATPGIPDAFGLAPSPYNYPDAGKRSLSSTAPLIMDSPEGEVYVALGGSGGSRIFGSVAQVLLNLDWGFDISNAVEQQRVHHQLSPAYVSIESGFRSDILEDLKARGHNVTLFDVNLGIAEVQAVVRQPSGRIFAASDSRKNGVPAAY